MVSALADEYSFSTFGKLNEFANPAKFSLMIKALSDHPFTLSPTGKPFDSSDWIPTLKHDGFRPLAYSERGKFLPVSRYGHEFWGSIPPNSGQE